jgi:hypothetical protein
MTSEDEKQERSTSLTIAPSRRPSGKGSTNYLLFIGGKELRTGNVYRCCVEMYYVKFQWFSLGRRRKGVKLVTKFDN